MSNSNFLSRLNGKYIIPIILIILLLFGTIYYFTYGSNDAKYTRSIKKIISTVNLTNNNVTSIYKYMDSGLSSFDKIKLTLETSKKDLDNVLLNVQKITPLDKYKKEHNNFINGIKYNKLLIMQSIATVDNYSSDTAKDSIGKLYEYLSSTTGYYEKSNIKNTKISLSKEFLNFPDKINNYINVLQKSEPNNSSKLNANLEFINDIKLNLDSLNSIIQGLESDINISKGGKLSPTQLTISISSKKTELSSVIDIVNNLTSPEDLSEIKTLFVSTGVLYDDYLNTFKKAIESSKKSDGVSIINSSINISNPSLESFKEKYSSLLSLITSAEESLR